jgi:hypothetical protein
VRTASAAEQRAQLGHVEPGSGPVHHRVEQSIHHRAGGEQQVAAVLDLVDRVVIDKAALLLLVDVQPEAQARGVDPPVDDLAQAPYRPRSGQGVCDLSEALGLADPSEAVALLGEAEGGFLPGAGDVLVAVEDHLSAERRVAADLDRHVPPRGVHDVKRVVVDELPRLLQVVDHSRPDRLTFHTVAGARATRTRNTPVRTGCSARYSSAI